MSWTTTKAGTWAPRGKLWKQDRKNNKKWRKETPQQKYNNISFLSLQKMQNPFWLWLIWSICLLNIPYVARVIKDKASTKLILQ